MLATGIKKLSVKAALLNSNSLNSQSDESANFEKSIISVLFSHGNLTDGSVNG